MWQLLLKPQFEDEDDDGVIIIIIIISSSSSSSRSSSSSSSNEGRQGESTFSRKLQITKVSVEYSSTKACLTAL